MKTLFAFAGGALMATGTAALAGGYVAPVVETPVVAPVVAPITSTDLDWSGFYVGGQVGKTTATQTGPAGAETDYDATSYGVHGGYLHDFGRFVGGAELSYDVLKDVEADGASASTDGDVLRGKLMAGYGAGRFLPYVAAGYAKASVDGVDGAADQDGDGYFYGLGAKFKATDNILVGAEVLRHEFSDFGDVDGNDLDATTVGLNVSWQF